MNEPSSISRDTLSNTKKGFALLITLSVLAAVIALTAVMMGYLDSARHEAFRTKALIQANLCFSDIKKTLTKVKDKKKLYTVLYQSVLPLQSEDNPFSVMLSCRPLDSGININWMGQGSNPKMQKQYTVAQQVFDALMQKYDVVDPARLEEILLQAMPQNGMQRSIDRQSRFRQKNGIISYQQFRQLLERYQFETDDPKIGRIGWSDYFVFRPMEKGSKNNMIYGDYLSVPMISILFDIDQESVKEAWSPSSGALKKLVAEYGLVYDPKLFFEKVSDRASCEISYVYQDETYRFVFDDISGEVKNFAFYSKQ